MNDLSLGDLQPIYLPPYISIMFRGALLYNLMRKNSEKNIRGYFDSFPTLQCNLDQIGQDICDII